MAKKLASIMKEMVLLVLKDKEKQPHASIVSSALMLANIAWNREVSGDDSFGSTQYDEAKPIFEKMKEGMANEFISDDPELLITKMRELKKESYADDNRFLNGCSLDEDGEIQVMSD